MTVQLAVGITVGVAAAAIVATLILRRLAPPGGFWGDPEPNHTGSVMGVIGSAFAILVAFTMFLAFESFLNARRNTDVEAAATQHLFETADLFRPGVRDGLRGDATC
jgi:large-conductance mechanosensitive channel